MTNNKLLPYEIDTWGHVWIKNKDGTVNTNAMDSDNHSGPMCEDCYYCFCDMCQGMPSERCEINDIKNNAIESLYKELGI